MERSERDGSEDSTDWYRYNEEDESEEWKVVYKYGPEQLDGYTLHSDLESFFTGHDIRGEYIGTSGPEDFARFTAAVASQTGLFFRQIMAHLSNGKQEIKITRLQEDGSYTPVPTRSYRLRRIGADAEEDGRGFGQA